MGLTSGAGLLRWILIGCALVAGCTQPNPLFVGGHDGSVPSDGSVLDQRWIDGRDRVDLGRADTLQFPEHPRGVDLLVVVDNSVGMSYAQQWLAIDVDSLIKGLEKLPGGPNYRIGVTTTDMGVGSFANSACTSDGDGGRLVLPPPCSSHGFKASFIEKVAGKANVATTADDALSCVITSIGEEGCGFEQPLEAMRAGIDVVNKGFIRQHAALAVIILTNEDDCSAVSNALFDDKDSSLGPYSSYRCFQHGILCGGKQPPCEQTVLGQCQPGQSMLHDVKTRYVDFLKALKPPGWVSVLVIAAPPKSTVQVSKEEAVCQVGAACWMGSYQQGYPAIRLEAFVDQLGEHGGLSSICANSYRPGLDALVQRIGAAF